VNDPRVFAADSGPGWKRSEELLTQIGSEGLPSLSPAELRELGLLHRQIAADLATARTYFPGTKIVTYLNQLALRSHNAVYRAPRRKPWSRVLSFVRSIPVTVRRRSGTVAASALILGAGALLAAIGTAVDESVAELAIGSGFAQEIQEGHYWIENLTETVPESALSGFLLTNNFFVALRVFTMGITGVLTAIGLFRNGEMLGSVLVICGQYGLLGRFIPFVVGHGVIEISGIILAGAGGFCIFDGWLHPGDRTRLAGLRAGARDGLRIFAAAVPAFLVAGFVEGLISTSEAVPGFLRIGLGIVLGIVLWLWLSVTGRSAATDGPES